MFLVVFVWFPWLLSKYKNSWYYKLLIIVCLKEDNFCSLVVEITPCSGYFIESNSLELSWIIQSGLAPFPGSQGSSGIVPNRPASLDISFNICQRLKCKHVALIPTLTMWLLWSNCTLPLIPKFLGVFSKTDTTLLHQHFLLDLRPSAEFSCKMHKLLRSLAEYLVALAFLCCL